MKLVHDLKGQWEWEKDGKLSSRRIEFTETRGRVTLKVYDGDDVFSLESLALNTESEPDGAKSYFLGNYWPKKDGTGFFSFESRFTESGAGGVFVNASEFTFLDADTLKQDFMGYRFDHHREKWAPFHQEEILKRVK
ncbi:MAG TPA: hypothetical protein PKM65_00015 [Spirochaetota bacterium]|nr:hypothetical protein [Spirochaetota bacterium]HNT12886.1 hypothetical protein [Spirochaetota bacterium]